MISMILAAMLQLTSGYNNTGVSGEVVAVQAATSNETANITVSAVDSLTTYTNTTAEVVSYETAYKVNLGLECEAVTNENDYFSYSKVSSANTWTLKKDMVWKSNVQTADGGNYTKVDAPTDFAPLNSTDSPIYSGTAANQIMAVAIPGDAAITSIYVVPWARVDGGEVSNTYWLVTHGLEDPAEITFPVGTVLTSKKSYDPATDTTISKVGSFSFNGATPTNFVGYVDYDALVAAGTPVVGEPQRYDMAITNEVVTGQAIADVYVATNDLATITTTNHFGAATVGSTYIFGGGIYVDGAADGDKINIIIK